MPGPAPTPCCPSVHHPTISEYYPLILRLEDYLKFLVHTTDWPAIFDRAGESSQVHVLVSGVLVSFADPHAAVIKDGWPGGGSRRVGPQIQSQGDVSGLFWLVLSFSLTSRWQLVSNVLMKIFRRGTQRKPMAKLSDIDILLKGYVVCPARIHMSRVPL